MLRLNTLKPKVAKGKRRGRVINSRAITTKNGNGRGHHGPFPVTNWAEESERYPKVDPNLPFSEWCKQAKRNEPNVTRWSATVPLHNFPSPVVHDYYREWDDQHVVQVINQAREKLKIMQSQLFNIGGDRDLDVASEMRRFIHMDVLSFLQRELGKVGVPQKEGDDVVMRDRLVQIGAGLFMSGLYLVMMGSNEEGGDEAKAASFHLEKVFRKDKRICEQCGHGSCDATSLCTNTPDTEKASATKKEDCKCAGLGWV